MADDTKNVKWTPERVKLLEGFWEEGLPASEIARRLGVTKNAVVGKVHRLGLKKRALPNKPAVHLPEAASKGASHEVSVPTQEIQKNGAGASGVSESRAAYQKHLRLEELTSGVCRWPEGEPGTEDFHFCGAPAVPEKPYCEDHNARAYVKASKRKVKVAAE